MCIVYTKEPSKKEGLGYKCFIKRNGKLYGDHSSYFGYTLCKPRPIGKWLHEKNYRPTKKTKTERMATLGYPHGWHVFTTIQGVKNWTKKPDEIMAKVQYRQAHTEGKTGITSRKYKCVVAKEIKILEEV